jgi:hypothetical protein
VSLRTWEPGKTYFKGQGESRVERKAAKKREAEARQREVRKAVQMRERMRCRIDAVPCPVDALDALRRGHWHHVTFRSKGGEDTVENTIWICASCHDLIHVKRLLAVEGNADAAPWLTIFKRARIEDEFYVWKQETGVRQYVSVD